ncbi:dentilisin complex subunit PrcB [Treponema sp. OMZ 792]|uniref:dentilisin complex subunit PrcB n=1 Tax=unclassified Treponema TaxID=2638727 RepID=UPI0020A493C7|nr:MULTISPECIES: dentilisin complex subunit PrcB [unclassified Treponema]UTC75199.1 dentilisin complex subunit PrcB [Treponema sp. OMZ 792]UTC79206.1 dentilisin complex subunit PrcB [Treponema sp. OMZ 798]
MNIKYFYISLFFVFLISSCAGLKECPFPETSAAPLKTGDANKIQYELLRSGNNAKNGIDQVIREQGRLDNLYAIIYGNHVTVPKIDFSRKAVVVITSGPFRTGGYRIEILSAIKTGNSIELVWGLIGPSPKDIVTQAITSPYSIFAVYAEPNDTIVLRCNDSLNINDNLNRL